MQQLAMLNVPHQPYRVWGSIEIYGELMPYGHPLSNDLDLIVWSSSESHARKQAHNRICTKYNLHPTLDQVIWCDDGPEIKQEATRS